MPKYIVRFQVALNGEWLENGTIGVISTSDGYQPKRIKSILTEQYRLKHPSAQAIAIVILGSSKVSNEEYSQASAAPIEIEFL